MKFFADDEGLIGLDPLMEQSRTPRALNLELLATKTDPRGRTKVIGLRLAVEAVWAWVRLGKRAPDALLFHNPPTPPLSTFALTKHAERACASIGRPGLKLTGKMFRIGGTQTLSALGVDAEDIARAGWTPKSTVWRRHYAADAHTVRARALATNRVMESAPDHPRR